MPVPSFFMGRNINHPNLHPNVLPLAKQLLFNATITILLHMHMMQHFLLRSSKMSLLYSIFVVDNLVFMHSKSQYTSYIEIIEGLS